VQRLHRYALVIVTTGALAATSTVAFADGGPGVDQLQKDCGTVAKDCQLVDVRDRKEFLAERKQVGDVAWGCASGGGAQAITWSDTVGTTTSVSGTATVSGGLATVINAGFSATFGTAWTQSKTVSETTTVTVKPGKVAWIVRSAPMQSVVGDLSMWYPKKVDGHYNWIVQNLTVTGPRDAAGNVVILDRDMTAQERKTVCAGNPGPTATSLVLTRHRMDEAGARHSTPVGPQVSLPRAGRPATAGVEAGRR
jgi:hypothetical protein